ncbi:MAG TPA: glycosyltransferase family 1 protein [Bryobacteraceae bacterium]|nr:glycosyltransferase family 1 protein [Bryobacteraceae bacterium]
MKIALDATYSLGPNPSGVGVYSKEILYGLTRAHPQTRFLFCYRPHRFLPSFATRIPSNASRRLLWKSVPASADLFHALNQRVESRHARTVVTFHDLFVMSGEYSTPEFRERFSAQARAAAERSDRIIAVSRFTAQQVQQYLHVDPARIRVVPHGVRPVPHPATTAAKEPLILFVGAIQRRKNIVRLVRAFEDTDPGWKLVLAGSYGYGSLEALARIETSTRKEDIQVLGYVSDAELERLYQRASVFAFPSLDEGFGMPLLDAMARGVPVLTSNSSAMPEVVGDAALLVDPLNVESITEDLRRITGDAALRDELIRSGFARSALFTWEKAVEQTWSVYGELLGKELLG